MQSWKEPLHEAANISGWHYKHEFVPIINDYFYALQVLMVFLHKKKKVLMVFLIKRKFLIVL